MTPTNPESDKVFAGSIPKLYDEYLVPLIFEPYATDLAQRLASRSVTRLLEIAAGTGVVTRALASRLPEDVAIVATDLNQAMLDQASAVGAARPVEWRQADAMRLPFADGTFDAVVCQFGVMFFPDRVGAFSEARRVLRPGGVFVFNAWDRIAENELADTVTTSLQSVFPGDPPRFLARTPHGYHDRTVIERDLAGRRFRRLTRRSRQGGGAEGGYMPSFRGEGVPPRERRREARSRRATQLAGWARRPTSQSKRFARRSGPRRCRRQDPGRTSGTVVADRRPGRRRERAPTYQAATSRTLRAPSKTRITLMARSAAMWGQRSTTLALRRSLHPRRIRA